MSVEFEAVVRYQGGFIPAGRITSVKLKDLFGKKVRVIVEEVKP